MLFSGADEVVAQAFEESAGQGEPGSGSGPGSEELGTAQRGGGEPLIGGDVGRDGPQARLVVEEIPVAAATVIATAASRSRNDSRSHASSG